MTQQVNLYNPALRQPRELVSARNLAIAAGACLLLVGATGGAARFALHRASAEAASAAQSLKTMQDQLAAVNALLAARQPNAALQREVEAAQSLLKSREEVLAALANLSIEPGKGFADYLRGLARQAVPGVWLTGISAGPGNELSLRGRTLNQALVAEYVKRLTGEPVFAGRRFAQLNMTRVEPKSAGGAATAAVDLSRQPIEFTLLSAPAAPAPATPSTANNGAALAAPLNLASLAGVQP